MHEDSGTTMFYFYCPVQTDYSIVQIKKKKVAFSFHILDMQTHACYYIKSGPMHLIAFSFPILVMTEDMPDIRVILLGWDFTHYFFLPDTEEWC